MTPGHVVTCRAPRKRGEPGVQCGGFVANLPGPGEVTRLLPHSRSKRHGSLVAGCKTCGTLHEILLQEHTASGIVEPSGYKT